MGSTLGGLRGLRVVSRVVEELKIVTVPATTHLRKLEEHHAQGLIHKHEHVPLKRAQLQVSIDGV